MQNNDTELIQRTLDGDQNAFTRLVEKYQKGIHALAWRKIGDFHIAQEITQDTFLRAYERLRTLKDPSRFPGWIYVIASHLCTEWHRKKKYPIQSLESTDLAEIEKVSHSQYIAEKRDTETAETQREIVQKLLSKLPESERTVMVLHYLGEMTYDTISKMLGVSQNTIKSRLNRARNRLKKEEALINENLSSFQLPAELTQNIMDGISRINPITPSTGKPFIPWMLSATSAILVLLLIGSGIQHLSLSFQPYDLKAESMITVEIVDTPVTLIRKIKPDAHNQLGTTDIASESQGTGTNADTFQDIDVTNIIPTIKTEQPFSTERWTQLDSPGRIKVSTLFATSTNHLYAMTPIGLYQMTDDTRRWDLINNSLPPLHPTMSIPIAEHDDTLFIVAEKTVIASDDNGMTWKPLGTRPEGKAIGLIVKDNGQDAIELYLALIEGMFYSNDGGVNWTSINNGLENRKIYAVTSTANALFAGTNRGIFRLNLESKSEDNTKKPGIWKQLPIVETKSIHAFAVSEHRIYIVAGGLKIMDDVSAIDIGAIAKRVLSKEPLWTVFRSTDQGDSWVDITPTKVLENKVVAKIRIVAEGKTVMLFIEPNTLRSTDEGKTWKTIPFGKLTGQGEITSFKAKDHSDNTHQDQYYVADYNGIRRSTDGGNSWKRFNTGLGGNIQNLTILNNKLYAVADGQVITSTDSGQSWKAIPVDLSGMYMSLMNRKIPLKTTNIKEITVSDGVLYAKGIAGLQPFLAYLDEEKTTLLPLEGLPTFGESNPIGEFMKTVKPSMEEKEKEDTGENATNFFKTLLNMGTDIFGGFAVSGNTFYVEYKRKLLIWSPSPEGGEDATWYDTKIEDNRDFTDFDSFSGYNSFKLGVNGDTVYVAKPDGVLLQSVDRGRTWTTMVLPITVKSFKQILITDAAVYLATEKHALYTHDSTEWNIVTDSNGQQLIIDHFAKDGNTLYAVSSTKNAQGGVYRLRNEDAHWEKITPIIPDKATSFTVSNGILYVGTENSGLQVIGLEEYSH